MREPNTQRRHSSSRGAGNDFDGELKLRDDGQRDGILRQAAEEITGISTVRKTERCSRGDDPGNWETDVQNCKNLWSSLISFL